MRELTDWVKEALFGALDVGRGRFIMVGNLISKTSVLANICKTKGVHVSTIYAVDSEGNPVWREKWTKEEAREYADFVGYRAWNKEMMHNPIVEGTVFRQEWIRWAKRPAWKDFSEFVLYIDPSWKSKKTNDTKAAKLWGKHKTYLWHLRAFVRKASVAELVRWCYDLYEWSQEIGIAIRFAIEASFMQDILLDEFTTEGEIRGYQLPITGDTRKSRTSSSASRPSVRSGNGALSTTTSRRRKTRTCRLVSNRRSPSRKAWLATTMRPTQTKGPSISFRRIQGNRFIHRGSANARPPKTNGK